VSSAGAVDKAELALEMQCVLGESPLWDPRAGELVWVDIARGDIFWWTPGAPSARRLPTGQTVSAIAPRASGGYVLATRSGFAQLDQAGGIELIAPVEDDRPENLMNDGKCDPAGRFWAGTMSETETPGAGSLYRLDLDGTVARVVRDVTVPNGLDWSPDGKIMYFVDSLAGGLDTFDFSVETGTVTARRRLVDIAGTLGLPDGMTTDSEGCIWVALYSGHAVHRYSPEGVLELRVELPVSLVTSCTFGGPELRDLFITTARVADRDEPLAGSVFCYEADVAGSAANLCMI
jgi:sugar lactone lactonase YvrE